MDPLMINEIPGRPIRGAVFRQLTISNSPAEMVAALQAAGLPIPGL